MARERGSDNVYIEELNGEHAIVSEGGRVLIITERFDRVLNRYCLDRSTASDFRLMYGNRFVWEERETKTRVVTAKVPLGKFWLEHPDRRQYREIVFDPTPGAQEDPDVYNLWRGFAVDAKQGEWGLWREHLFEIGAAGDTETFEFLLDWVAWMVQFPHRQGETAIVWRGRQGAGKGLIARTLGRIVGQHFVHVFNVKHLVGNFNAHLRDALLVFSDEALWAGDKAAEGILKAMVTEPTLLLEQKGRDIFTVPNRIHLLMATNNEWAAPVGVDDRRFCIVDVPDSHIGDKAYFQRLLSHLAQGGLEAFLFDMLARPVEHAPAPPTSASAQASALTQKLHSMPPVWHWWYEKLDSGEILKSTGAWAEEIAKSELHEDYLKFADQVNISRRASETTLALALHELMPISLRSARRQGVDARRARVWCLPPLAECRAHFGKAVKIPTLFDGHDAV